MNIRDRIKEMRRVPGRELRANPLNFRKHPTQQRSALAGILQQIGIASALIARETPEGLELIDGHLRAEDYGDAEWPVLVLDVTEAEARLLLATLDPLAALAEQDSEALKSLVAGMTAADATLAKAALDADTLRKLFEPLAGQCDPDDVPEAPSEPLTQPGDIWQLGSHRLICGDSRAPATVAAVLGKAKATTVTDPPYGIGYKYDQHDDASGDGNAELVAAVFAAAPAARVWTPGLMNLARELAANPSAKVLAWHKGFAQAGNGLGGASTWEPVLVVGVKGGSLPNDYLHFGTDREPDLRKKHPCPKPVALFVHLIETLTKGAIFEPFAGSGTTLIAAEQLGRRCYAIEISPAYCDIIVARWEKFTGKKATRTE